MRRLFDKSVILLMCLPFVFLKGSLALPVICILAILTCTCLFEIISSDKPYIYIIPIIYCISTFALPELLLFIPIIVYDIAVSRKPIFLIIPLVSVATGISRLQDNAAGLLIFGIMVSLALAIKSIRLDDYEKKLIKIRDDNIERQNLLSERNRQLLDRQDYEIRLATLGERNRIAREIHDNVGHMLSRSILQIGAMKVVEKDELMKEQLTSVGQTLSGAMDSIRMSVHRLHDESINLTISVKDALSAIRKDINVVLDCDIPETVPTKLKLCFIGIIKEAVSNVIKHSDCDKVTVLLREHPAFWQLVFSDNGSQKAIKDSGIGLQNIRDRVMSLGGVCEIDNKNGFRIFVTVSKKELLENENNDN